LAQQAGYFDHYLSVMASNHRYLDVMTVRPSHAGVAKTTKQAHNHLMIEPVVMPDISHIVIDHDKNDAEPCLFYPNGDKNKNIRREIEHTVVKHHLIEHSQFVEKHKKQYFRYTKKDKYANARGPPLYYGKKYDPEVDRIVSRMKDTEKKIVGTVQIRLG
jgi:hypothetical protein